MCKKQQHPRKKKKKKKFTSDIACPSSPTCIEKGGLVLQCSAALEDETLKQSGRVICRICEVLNSKQSFKHEAT